MRQVTATGKALEQAQYRYEAGLVTYLEVSSTETTALQAQLTRVSILNRRMSASVLLIRALGGGWRVTRVEESLVRRVPLTPRVCRLTHLKAYEVGCSGALVSTQHVVT